MYEQIWSLQIASAPLPAQSSPQTRLQTLKCTTHLGLGVRVTHRPEDQQEDHHDRSRLLVSKMFDIKKNNI